MNLLHINSKCIYLKIYKLHTSQFHHVSHLTRCGCQKLSRKLYNKYEYKSDIEINLKIVLLNFLLLSNYSSITYSSVCHPNVYYCFSISVL